MIKDKIWFTYISRIETSKKLKLWDKVTELLLVWYSLLAVIGGAFALIVDSTLFGNDKITNFFLFSMSIAVLVSSLVVTGQNFKIRSVFAEQNYKKLQQLYNSVNRSENIDEPKIQAQYDALLAESENHTTFDFDKARFRKTFLIWEKCNLELTTTLKSKQMSLQEFVFCYVRVSIFWLICCCLFMLPLIPILLKYLCVK